MDPRTVLCVLLDIAPGAVAGFVLMPFVLIAAAIVIVVVILARALKKRKRAEDAPPARADAEPDDEETKDR